MEAARTLGPMNKVVLTGGEPSFHSQFGLMAYEARRSFQCATLAIETNAFGFKRFPEHFLHFDEIHVTHYRADTYVKSPPKDGEMAFMREFLQGHGGKPALFVREIDPHFTRKIHANPVMCARGWNGFVSFMHGRIFGCCTAQGVEGALSVPLTPNWRDEIMNTELPCERCLFAGP